MLDGTLDTIATDHAPHHYDEKEQAFDAAPNGIVGIETSLGLIHTHFVKTGKMSLTTMVERMCVSPARTFGLEGGSLEVGKVGDVTVFDPEAKWTVDPDDFLSMSGNTPFTGWELEGRARWTIVEGRIVYGD